MLCHGTVCVVGKIRDLILQLSKSSIYSTKPVNANNIGNREYVSGCYGTGNCYWGAERSVMATVGYDF
ncbi:hypothetical protein CI612_14010 [Klebsiella quasipneumoniae subsp. similipneumoniae]|nr:hypothetical protein CI612_14010 [Klebsiella quasipneumoniae subsp. similipneumoniae]